MSYSEYTSTVKLSIIVPFFNAQHYLQHCLLSLLEQDVPHDEYEVIAVNDASTDNSYKVVENLQEKFSNIQLLNLHTNVKQGGARNHGLLAARGEWVWFVDSDDYIECNVLRQLLDYCSDDNDLDFIHFDYSVERDGFVTPSDNKKYRTVSLSGEDFFNYTHHNWWATCVNVWQRITRRAFLIKNGLLFAENVQIEDVDYSFHCFIKAKRVKHIELIPYVYRYVSYSSSHNPKSSLLFNYQYKLVLRCIDILRISEPGLQMQNHIHAYIKYMLTESISTFCSLTGQEKKIAVRMIKKISIVKVLPYVNRRNFFTIMHLFLIW